MYVIRNSFYNSVFRNYILARCVKNLRLLSLILLNNIDIMTFNDYNKREKYNLNTRGVCREDKLQEIMDNAH